MSAGAADPQAIASRGALPPPPWSLPFAWMGALLFVLSLGYFVYSYGVRFARVTADGPHVRPILINVALFTVFAAHHSVFARVGAKARVHRLIHPVVEPSVYVWIASLLLIAVCWYWQFVPGLAYELPAPWSWFGYGAQCGGVLLIVNGSKRLDVLDLAGVRPVLVYPASATQRVPLMTSGVYGFVRHPIYLGWALLVFGAPYMTATRLVFAIVSTAYLIVAMPWEERGLIRQFGAEYEAYRRRVGWRMLPGVY